METYKLSIFAIILFVLFIVGGTLLIIIGATNERISKDQTCLDLGYEGRRYGEQIDYCLKGEKAFPIVFDCKGIFKVKCEPYFLDGGS